MSDGLLAGKSLGGEWRSAAVVRQRRRKTKYKGNSGFLHCAAHDETVNSFGRNDDLTVEEK
jgi:hypothetical protein